MVVMIHKWIIAAAILSVAVALPMRSHLGAEQIIETFRNSNIGRSSAIESLIQNALEDFRQIMTTGTGDIPVLDPLHVQHVVADDDTIPIPGARVELNDLVVSQLSTFEMTEVTVNTISAIFQRYAIQIQGQIPVIDVEVGGYDLLVDVMGLAVFGKGDGKITVVKPWLRIDTNVNIRLGLLALYLNINDLRLDFGLDDIQFGIRGMFNNPTVDDFVNRFLRNLILEFAEFWMDEISDIVSPAVKDVANDILSDINLIDFLG